MATQPMNTTNTIKEKHPEKYLEERTELNQLIYDKEAEIRSREKEIYLAKEKFVREHRLLIEPGDVIRVQWPNLAVPAEELELSKYPEYGSSLEGIADIIYLFRKIFKGRVGRSPKHISRVSQNMLLSSKIEIIKRASEKD